METWKQRNSALILLTISAILLYLRSPELLETPRIWAEDGSVFLGHAFTVGSLESLGYVYQPAGYVVLYANLAGAVASMLPLIWAPSVFAGFSVALQLLVCWLIIASDSAAFDGWVRKLLSCFVVLAGPGVISEIWLNTINAQIFFGGAAVVIALNNSDHSGRSMRWFRRTVLILGSLTGVYTVILTPIFWLRVWLRRSSSAALDAAMVSMGAAIQLVTFFVAHQSESWSENRIQEVDWDRSFSIVAQWHVLIPVLGHDLNRSLTSYFPTWVVCMFALLIVVFLAHRITKEQRQRIEHGLILCVAWLLLVLGTTVTRGGMPGGRYAVLSGWIVGWLLLSGSDWRKHQPASSILAGLVVVMLGAGIWAFRFPPQCTGKAWAAEVAAWERGAKTELAICPRHWRIELPPVDNASHRR